MEMECEPSKKCEDLFLMANCDSMYHLAINNSRRFALNWIETNQSNHLIKWSS